MDKALYLLKSGEIWLKRGSRPFFERMLRRHLKRTLKPYSPEVIMQKGRFFLKVAPDNLDAVERKLSRTFGLVGFSRAWSTSKDMQEIRSIAVEICGRELKRRNIKTFKIASRRSDKGFPLDSYQISCDLGNAVTEAFPGMRVQLSNPDLTISVELRDKAYLYGPTIGAPGGLPTGSAGKGLLMLSGGIDSPVAGYLMAKRGLSIDALYFHAYPFTSDEAREKVEDLAKVLSEFHGGIRLWVVSFTDVQLEIKRIAVEGEHTLHLRSAMVQTANVLAQRIRASCLITGESLSQVASQTVESLNVTNSVSYLPVFRPLIGLDKEDIINLARTIGTYETSILPYEDCCTIFSSKHPLVKPDREIVTAHYRDIGLDALIEQAAADAELVKL